MVSRLGRLLRQHTSFKCMVGFHTKGSGGSNHLWSHMEQLLHTIIGIDAIPKTFSDMGRYETNYRTIDRIGIKVMAIRALYYVWIDTGGESIALGGCCGDFEGYYIG